jgi:hypothetical protein
MQTQAIVTRLLQCCAPLMHAARWQVLRDVAMSAVCGRALTLTQARTAQHKRIDRGTPACLVMKPRRSSVCIIWLTEGADTRKCRWISDSAGALPN